MKIKDHSINVVVEFCIVMSLVTNKTINLIKFKVIDRAQFKLEGRTGVSKQSFKQETRFSLEHEDFHLTKFLYSSYLPQHRFVDLC